MGTFTYLIIVRNPQTGASVGVEALVDTGVTFTVLPDSLLRSIRLTPVRTVEAELANGDRIQLPLGYADVEIDGQSAQVTCAFGREGVQPLLGATTLEVLLLAADPVHQRLIPRPALLM